MHYGIILTSLHLNFRLHEFVWHRTDPISKTRKIPRALKFIKLRVIPDQFYYNIEVVSVLVCVWLDGGGYEVAFCVLVHNIMYVCLCVA